MDNNNQENNALGILGGEHPLLVVVALAALQEVKNLREKLAEAEDRIRELTDVAKEIFAEIEAEIEAALESNYKARSSFDIHDEFYQWVQGKIDALRGIQGFIEELKKKYPEDEE